MSAAANLPPSSPHLPVCVFVLTVRDPQGDVTHLIHFVLSVYFIIFFFLFAVNQPQFLGLVVGGILVKKDLRGSSFPKFCSPNNFSYCFPSSPFFYSCAHNQSIGPLWVQRLHPTPKKILNKQKKPPQIYRQCSSESKFYIYKKITQTLVSFVYIQL